MPLKRTNAHMYTQTHTYVHTDTRAHTYMHTWSLLPSTLSHGAPDVLKQVRLLGRAALADHTGRQCIQQFH
jgi:hypothetical protein